MDDEHEELNSDFYDAEYFTKGTKSNYGPYGPGSWADDLADMIWKYHQPASVLDVGCAYGFVVKRLRKHNIPVWGFDISEFAVKQADDSGIWTGDAANPLSYKPTDLIVATELPEHLTERQSRLFLRNGYKYADRMLLLIAAFRDDEAVVDLEHEKDKSHINIKPMEWWRTEARAAGWKIGSGDGINADRRSQSMQWHGRFLYLEK